MNASLAADPVLSAKPDVDRLLESLGHIVLDKPQQIKLSLACLLAGGHLLLQDLPGMGKTTLAESLARSLGLDYRRIQFTSDMLPADILGLSIFNPEKQQFEYRPGPIFTQILLADEINRSSPNPSTPIAIFCDRHPKSDATIGRVSLARVAVGSVFDVFVARLPVDAGRARFVAWCGSSAVARQYADTCDTANFGTLAKSRVANPCCTAGLGLFAAVGGQNARNEAVRGVVDARCAGIEKSRSGLCICRRASLCRA